MSMTISKSWSKKDIKKFKRATKKFRKKMLFKFNQKQQEGFFGWNELENYDAVWERLENHVKRGSSQAVDIANLAMMIWYLDKKKEKE
jgi:hypothetical protein